MTWINDTPANWMDYGRRLYQAWDEHCEDTGDPVEALEPDHPQHHLFESWVATFEA